MATLPNRKLSTVSIPQLDSEHISLLCSNYSINNEQSFYDSIRHAVRMYLLSDRIEKEKQQKEQISNKKTLLNAAKKHSAALCEVIAKLGVDEYQDFGGYEFVDQMEEGLLHFEASAKNSLARTNGEKGKKTGNEAFHLFIRDIYKIYTNVTGKHDRYIYNSENNEYSGLFFEFIKEIIRYIDIAKTNSALASDITISLSEKSK